MPELAAKTLVAAHETTIERWKQEKPEQYTSLTEPVRTDPIYRPLAPTDIEAAFYRDRRARIQSMPRYQLRGVREKRDGHLHAFARIAEIVDTDRMGVYRARVSDILAGATEWPDDVLAFAREAIPREAGRAPHDASAGSDSRAGRPRIARVLSPSVIENVARVKRVDAHVLHRALDDLQHRVAENLEEIVRECGFEQFAPDHVVVDAGDWVVADALAGYDDRTRAAVALAHARSYPDAAACAGVPLHVACAPAELRGLSEQCADVRNTAKANESV